MKENDTSRTILRMDFNQVNCYLVKIENGFVLIDTGYSKNREEIMAAMTKAGCVPGKLKLIILTHGDFDHSGNCAYFRERFNCKVAMHRNDVGMVQYGDMFWKRDVGRVSRALGKMMMFVMRIKLDEEDRFIPDLLLENGQSLSEFGFDATVHLLSGHSKGSIGLLTADGDFFCGDPIMNTRRPERTKLVADREDYERSLETIKRLNFKVAYPGHGAPFSLDALTETQ